MAGLQKVKESFGDKSEKKTLPVPSQKDSQRSRDRVKKRNGASDRRDKNKKTRGRKGRSTSRSSGRRSSSRSRSTHKKPRSSKRSSKSRSKSKSGRTGGSKGSSRRRKGSSKSVSGRRNKSNKSGQSGASKSSSRHPRTKSKDGRVSGRHKMIPKRASMTTVDIVKDSSETKLDKNTKAYLMCAKMGVGLSVVFHIAFVVWMSVVVTFHDTVPVSTGLLLSVIHLIVAFLSLEVVLYSTRMLCLFTMGVDVLGVLASFVYIAIRESSTLKADSESAAAVKLLHGALLSTEGSCVLLMLNLCFVVTLYSEIHSARSSSAAIGIQVLNVDVERANPQTVGEKQPTQGTGQSIMQKLGKIVPGLGGLGNKKPDEGNKQVGKGPATGGTPDKGSSSGSQRQAKDHKEEGTESHSEISTATTSMTTTLPPKELPVESAPTAQATTLSNPSATATSVQPQAQVKESLSERFMVGSLQAKVNEQPPLPAKTNSKQSPPKLNLTTTAVNEMTPEKPKSVVNMECATPMAADVPSAPAVTGPFAAATTTAGVAKQDTPLVTANSVTPLAANKMNETPKQQQSSVRTALAPESPKAPEKAPNVGQPMEYLFEKKTSS